MADPLQYFASETDPQKLVAAVAARVGEVAKQFDFSEEANAYEHLFGASLRLGSQSMVVTHGDAQQLIKMRVNKAKALRASLVGLILGPPLTWRASARNADVESRSVVLMGQNLLEFSWKQNGLGVFCGEWVGNGIAFKASYALADWMPQLGEAVAPDYTAGDGQLLWSGGLRVREVLPWDVYFDSEYRSWQDVPWVCIRTYENRFDLAALESDEATKAAIIGASGDWLTAKGGGKRNNQSPDVVAVHRLWHKPCPAVPNGLELRFLDGQTVIGQPKPCGEIPLERFSPDVRADSAHGDSQWQSTLGIQEMTDSVHSSVASNFNALGTQAVMMDSRDNISRDRLNNLMVFETAPGREKPAGLQLTRNPEGFDKWLEMMASAQTDLVGLNDVAMGSPDTAQMNAEAFTLLASMAVQRNGATQRRALDAIGRLGQRVIKVLAENMSEEQAISIAGRAAQLSYPMQDVTPDKLKAITSVHVEVGNAMEQTSAGRLQLLQLYMQSNPNMRPEDMQQVIETGRLEQAMNVQRDEDLFIAWEIDEILAGRSPVVHVSDDHLKHCAKHRVVVLTPAARASEAVIKADAQHFLMHYREFYGTPEGVDPRSDPQYFDRMRVLLGQSAPSAVGPPPMGGPPAGGPTQPEQGGSSPPSNLQGIPPALEPPKAEGAQPPEAPPTVLQ